MKKPSPSADQAKLDKYAAFLATKAVKNKQARDKKALEVAKLKQAKKASNRMIAFTREEWLMTAVELLKPVFAERGYIVPDTAKATIGFPCKGAGGKRIGECHCSSMSKGGFYEIFISPLLDDATRILGTLVHELCHAIVGTQHGHKAPFKKCALAMHLEGKMRATTEGEAFKRMVLPILAELGPLPHKALSLEGVKRQKGRNLKVECPCCGFKLRASKAPLLEIAVLDTTGSYIECPNPRCTEPNLDEIFSCEADKAKTMRRTHIYLDIEAQDEEE